MRSLDGGGVGHVGSRLGSRRDVDSVLSRWGWDVVVASAHGKDEAGRPNVLVWLRGPRREPVAMTVDRGDRRVAVVQATVPPEAVADFLGHVAERESKSN